MGLVKQAVSALTKRKIMQLTHTYITLPLSGKPGILACATIPFVRAAAVCPSPRVAFACKSQYHFFAHFNTFG